MPKQKRKIVDNHISSNDLLLEIDRYKTKLKKSKLTYSQFKIAMTVIFGIKQIIISQCNESNISNNKSNPYLLTGEELDRTINKLK